LTNCVTQNSKYTSAYSSAAPATKTKRFTKFSTGPNVIKIPQQFTTVPTFTKVKL